MASIFETRGFRVQAELLDGENQWLILMKKNEYMWTFTVYFTFDYEDGAVFGNTLNMPEQITLDAHGETWVIPGDVLDQLNFDKNDFEAELENIIAKQIEDETYERINNNRFYETK